MCKTAIQWALTVAEVQTRHILIDLFDKECLVSCEKAMLSLPMPISQASEIVYSFSHCRILILILLDKA